MGKYKTENTPTAQPHSSMLWIFLSQMGSLPKPDAVTPKSPSSFKAEGFLFAQVYHWVGPLGAPLLCHSPEPRATGHRDAEAFPGPAPI